MLDRVIAGERLIVTRDGRPVAELRPLRRPTTGRTDLPRRWSRRPHVDPDAVRADIDGMLHPSR